MKDYRHIIFDLDGTLTDSRPGIINSGIYAFSKLGFSKPPVDKLNEMIGIPLQEYLRLCGNLAEPDVELAVKHYRHYYGEKGAFENGTYPGIPELLGKLRSAGKKMYISTAKYEKFAKVVADYFGLTPMVLDLVGADGAGNHATKTELTAKIIERNKIVDLVQTVVVGDKHMDVMAGHENNIDSIGVTYGFGSREELMAYNPTFLVDNVGELEIILG